METYNFEVHSGVKIIDGKVYWPNQLYLSIPRFYAWELVQTLLNQIRRNEENIEVYFSGELKENVEQTQNKEGG